MYTDAYKMYESVYVYVEMEYKIYIALPTQGQVEFRFV